MKLEEKRSFINTLNLMITGLESHAKDRANELGHLTGNEIAGDRELGHIWSASALLRSAQREIGQITIRPIERRN